MVTAPYPHSAMSWIVVSSTTRRVRSIRGSTWHGTVASVTSSFCRNRLDRELGGSGLGVDDLALGLGGRPLLLGPREGAEHGAGGSDGHHDGDGGGEVEGIRVGVGRPVDQEGAGAAELAGH